jgi:hypothetical protein
MPITVQNNELGSLAIATQVITSNQTTTATTSGTATALATIGPVGVYGLNYIAELWAVAITKGTTNISVELWLDGAFNQSILPLSVNATNPAPILLRSQIALTDGVHTLTWRAFVDAGTGTLVAGAGTTGVAPNATARLIVA